jgi:hypothetical protein
MVKNIESKDAAEVIDNKKKDESVNVKVAKDEAQDELSKRDKFFNRVSQKIKDLVSKKTAKEKSVEDIKKSTGIGKIPLNLKKFIPLSPLLIIILFAAYIQFFSKGKPGTTNVNTFPTPTYSPYQKFKPSVYADDPVVIGLEETINVLDREMSTTPLTESTLTPPVLDFNIGF